MRGLRDFEQADDGLAGDGAHRVQTWWLRLVREGRSLVSRVPRRTRLVLAVLAALLVVGLLRWVVLPWAYHLPESGLGASYGPPMNPKAPRAFYPPKTAWDWLQLLVVPVVLAGAALWFNATEKRRDQEIAQKNRATDQAIAEERQQEAALETYLATMTSLLLDRKLRQSTEDSEVRAVARVQTLTTLSRLDGVRKRVVVEFLYESHLIDKGKPIVDLDGANLDDVTLGRSNLEGVQLWNVSIFEANLTRANLQGADLRGAAFTNGYLMGTYLAGANLANTRLDNVYLHGADLTGADLTGAYLRKANLIRATGTTPEQLAQAESLEGAIMPDGSTHP